MIDAAEEDGGDGIWRESDGWSTRGVLVEWLLLCWEREIFCEDIGKVYVDVQVEETEEKGDVVEVMFAGEGQKALIHEKFADFQMYAVLVMGWGKIGSQGNQWFSYLLSQVG